MPKRAVSSATTRSQTIVSSQPPPRAWPWTAAIVGFEISSTARKERERLLDVGATVTGPAELAEALDVAADGEALAGPVEDEDPDGGSPSASVDAGSRSSVKKPRVIAFSFSGRSSVSQATGPRTSYEIIAATLYGASLGFQPNSWLVPDARPKEDGRSRAGARDLLQSASS